MSHEGHECVDQSQSSTEPWPKFSWGFTRWTSLTEYLAVWLNSNSSCLPTSREVRLAQSPHHLITGLVFLVIAPILEGSPRLTSLAQQRPSYNSGDSNGFRSSISRPGTKTNSLYYSKAVVANLKGSLSAPGWKSSLLLAALGIALS